MSKLLDNLCGILAYLTNDFIKHNGIDYSFKADESWVILSPIEQGIKKKIEEIGKPLKEWDIKIYRGILTGYNEAFIIDERKKNELIAEDPKSDEIIRPILRGRDIKRYGYEFADLYLIATFPSLKIDIENYPAVKNHLLSFGMERLEQTGKKYIIDGKKIEARKKTSNKWFETQDSISYWDDFYKQKIAWMSVGKTYYSLIPEDFILLDTNYFFTIKTEFLYLLGMLNSKLIFFEINRKDTKMKGRGIYRHYKYNLEDLLIYKPTVEIKQQIENYLLEKNYKAIDTLIYKLYGLNESEVDFIETHFRSQG